MGIRIWDGARYATANLVLLAPDRAPAGGVQPTPAQLAQNFRADAMRNVTNLFPMGVTLATYNGWAAAQQGAYDTFLVSTVHQGYVGGDSEVASTMIGKLRIGGFRVLNRTITPTLDAANQVDGYDVNFEQRIVGNQVNGAPPIHVGIPTFAQRAIYGYAGSGGLPTLAQQAIFGFAGSGGLTLSLWYTVYEMAYVEAYRRGNPNFNAGTTVGLYTQPAASPAGSLDALRRVALLPANNLGQDLFLANTAQGALIAQLSDPTALMTAASKDTFAGNQVALANLKGIDIATSYAVVSYNAMNTQITLRSPRDSTLLPTITLAEFRDLFQSLTTSA